MQGHAKAEQRLFRLIANLVKNFQSGSDVLADSQGKGVRLDQPFPMRQRPLAKISVQLVIDVSQHRCWRKRLRAPVSDGVPKL